MSSHFAVKIQHIKCKETDSDLDILNLDIFPFSFAELLEGHEFTREAVDSNGLGI